MFREMSGVFKCNNNVVLVLLVLAIKRTNRETRVKVNNNFASERDALHAEIERVVEEQVAVRCAGTGAQPGAPDRCLRWRPQLMRRHASHAAPF